MCRLASESTTGAVATCTIASCPSAACSAASCSCDGRPTSITGARPISTPGTAGAIGAPAGGGLGDGRIGSGETRRKLVGDRSGDRSGRCCGRVVAVLPSVASVVPSAPTGSRSVGAYRCCATTSRGTASHLC
eukprot:scaffold90053_cov58-Phaeocystis_antarctica.AAC.6